MSKTLYGDAFISLGLKYVSCGDPDEMHDIFDLAVKNGAKRYEDMPISHPLNVHQRVLNALDRDERFKKEYIHYTRIIKRPCRIFSLKVLKCKGIPINTAIMNNWDNEEDKCWDKV